MKKLVLAAVLVGAGLALPAQAQRAGGVQCSSFTAMSEDDQKSAVKSARAESRSGDSPSDIPVGPQDPAAIGEPSSDEMMVMQVVEMCRVRPSVTIADVIDELE